MKQTYIKFIAQKTTDTHTILVTVIPNDMLGKDLPSIYELQGFKMPSTIYTGTYPQLKLNTDTIKERDDLKGLGIAGILTSEDFYCQEQNLPDPMGISLENEKN